jgi:predicted dienelactone hydrolase
MSRNYYIIVAVCFLTCLVVSAADEPGYDPLKVTQQGKLSEVKIVVEDKGRGRSIPLKLYFLDSTRLAPVILFSHGLGGSREGSQFLGKHWAARGYICVFLQHPGSDESVWKDLPVAERMAALREAADAKNFLLRVQDVPVVIDQLAAWNDNEGHELAQRMNMDKIGMSGHSFGAVTTQAVSGQTTARGRGLFTEKRILAALPMSPSTPKGSTAEQAFGTVKIPWLLMTGTNDVSVIGDQTVESRLAVFPALPPGNKYELVLNKAQHSAFTDRPLPGDKEERNPKHHASILALSTAFWDAYLKGDKDAKAWLDGDGPKAILEKEDRWQKK